MHLSWNGTFSVDVHVVLKPPTQPFLSYRFDSILKAQQCVQQGRMVNVKCVEMQVANEKEVESGTLVKEGHLHFLIHYDLVSISVLIRPGFLLGSSSYHQPRLVFPPFLRLPHYSQFLHHRPGHIRPLRPLLRPPPRNIHQSR